MPFWGAPTQGLRRDVEKLAEADGCWWIGGIGIGRLFEETPTFGFIYVYDSPTFLGHLNLKRRIHRWCGILHLPHSFCRRHRKSCTQQLECHVLSFWAGTHETLEYHHETPRKPPLDHVHWEKQPHYAPKKALCSELQEILCCSCTWPLVLSVRLQAVLFRGPLSKTAVKELGTTDGTCRTTSPLWQWPVVFRFGQRWWLVNSDHVIDFDSIPSSLCLVQWLYPPDWQICQRIRSPCEFWLQRLLTAVMAARFAGPMGWRAHRLGRTFSKSDGFRGLFWDWQRFMAIFWPFSTYAQGR